jgi:hypothetical protein
MLRRALTAISGAAVLLLALGAPGLAAGWAVTALDQLPSEFRAGETYQLG